MKDASSVRALRIALEKRILNEFASKILNEEKMDRHIESQRGTRLSEHALVPFHCECDDEDCLGTVEMSTEEYKKVHGRTRNFIVMPTHVRLDIEEVIVNFPKYSVVGKFFPYQSKSDSRGH